VSRQPGPPPRAPKVPKTPKVPETPTAPETPDILARALLPLRAFLGITFCFAGMQKLANPGFFDPANPISIQAQLAGAARRSPIHALVGPLAHIATPLGLLIAFAELAIGVGTLLGLWQRLAAIGGIVLSLMLFLAVSFHSAPYYTGADIVFVFAWPPLALAGAGPVLSADAAIAARAHAAMAARPSRRISEQEASRREVVLKGTVTGVVAVASLFLGGAVAGLGRLAGRAKPAGTGAALAPSAQPSTSASTAGPGVSPAASGGAHPAGTAIGPAKDVPVGNAAGFSDPATGDPSVVIQPKAGTFLAFDAVCPHAGCTVQYDPSAKVLVCPCHGSQFSASTGAVQLGPAATGLNPIKIAEGGDGQLYVT
jgi:thiosulfate dehydrogenase (quinone) large subunit